MSESTPDTDTNARPGRTCIGIHVHAEPQLLAATLASVRANTPPGYELLLLPDGPDVATRMALRGLHDVAQSATAERRGAAACFNRLATLSRAEVVVLIESGSLVARRWLEHLLAALAADARNGLAGPSTNRAWNEQCVFAGAGGSPGEIARTAQRAASQFGDERRVLEPLHSLADFCYAVRRDVLQALGAADEAYGLGPCWEMDYNIRAARAGFRALWACAAYVYRAPATVRRRGEEARRFEASKRRYQDKFCGARLRNEKTDYRPHCHGDACPNFAPAGVIEIRRAPPEVPVPETANAPHSRVAAAAPLAPVGAPRAAAHVSVREPLVSCILPTHDRRSFIPQAIRCFLRQDYPNLELVIVDDGSDPIADCIPASEHIRYLRLDRKLTIGAKRNLACSQARGELIVHWDDDDWYPPWRVSAQAQTLLGGPADLCGSSRVYYHDGSGERAWEYRYPNSGPRWVSGNTLAYRRRFWERQPFAEIQIGEDTRFVWGAVNHVLFDLADPRLCVASVHAGNTSRKVIRSNAWQVRASAEIHQLLGDDRYFYEPLPSGTTASGWPLVSCIMPTGNRRGFVLLALAAFRAQDYPRRELVVVDDGEDAVGDLMPADGAVRYVRLSRRATIGEKRNIACEAARGEVIAHWDDDDWYAADRLRYQIAPLLAGTADITGLDTAFVLDLQKAEFWTTEARLHQRMFVGNVHGGTLVYRKRLVTEGVRYPTVSLAEDAWLLRRALQNGQRLLRLGNPGVFVYMRHGRNAWRQFAPGRFLDPSEWRRVGRPPLFSAATLDAYRGAMIENALPHVRQDQMVDSAAEVEHVR